MAPWCARRRVRWQATADLITVDRLDHTASLLASFASVLKSLGDVARSRYAVGQAEQTDVIRAQLETARFDEELITLRTDRQAAVARLNAIALRPPLARIDTIILPAPLDSLPSVTDLVNRSVRERPLLARVGGEVVAAAGDVEASALGGLACAPRLHAARA